MLLCMYGGTPEARTGLDRRVDGLIVFSEDLDSDLASHRARPTTKERRGGLTNRITFSDRSMLANKGVANVIRHRTPICSGAHWPLQLHHFSNLDFCSPARPSGATSRNPPAAGRTSFLTAAG